jgi:chemotaxis family two-component system response regulator Rcp1
MESIGRDAAPIEVLLVEDKSRRCPAHRGSIHGRQGAHQSARCIGWAKAMAFLKREGEHANAPRPDLILLDLNLPKKDGREVLAEIKGDPKLKCISVVILTTSSSEADILRSYQLHAIITVTSQSL